MVLCMDKPGSLYQIQGSYPQPYGSGLEAATNDKEMGSTGYMLMSFYIWVLKTRCYVTSVFFLLFIFQRQEMACSPGYTPVASLPKAGITDVSHHTCWRFVLFSLHKYPSPPFQTISAKAGVGRVWLTRLMERSRSRVGRRNTVPKAWHGRGSAISCDCFLKNCRRAGPVPFHRDSRRVVGESGGSHETR